MTSVLGISSFYHDSAASLIVDGEIVAAVQEERFTRLKHDSSFPVNSIKFILKFSNLKLKDIDAIIFYEKPFLKFERLLETYLAFAPKGFLSFSKAMPIWLKEKLFQKRLIIQKLKEIDNSVEYSKKLFFSEHHMSHAASAFFPSPFDKAIILTADGVGEWATTTVAVGEKNNIEIKKEIHFPHSLGLLYSAFTYYTGFKVNSGEYKLMGLAPYGKPKYKKIIEKYLIDIKNDGSFRLDQNYFNYASGLTMTNRKFNDLFSQPPRDPKKDKINQFHMDIASSIQAVTEDVILKLTSSIKEEYKINNLCLAGGVALNCVANGKIYKNGIFKNVWIQPASGDAGGSLGGALSFWHLKLGNKRTVNKLDSMKGAFLGPEYSNIEIQKILNKISANFEILNEEDLLKKTSESLAENNIIGWFQGRMEFGPRALGGRSILGNPKSPDMQKNLNLKIKYRESFRPFAPAVLSEDKNEWFEIDIESPYMLLVSQINKKIKKEMTEDQKKLFGIEKLKVLRSEIPAVTHVDYSSRIQTVTKDKNILFYKLISNFKNKTGCPILINTSFNVRGEPIVNTPEDAFRCFMGTNIDKLVIGNCFLDKDKQKLSLKKDYKLQFELD